MTNELTVIKEVEKNKGEVKYTNEPEDTPEAKFIQSISLGLTDYYRRQHIERIKRGLVARRQRLETAQSK